MQAGWWKVRRLFREDGGQDLSEYCLLTALIVLVAIGIFLKVSGGIQGPWTSANTALSSTTSGTAASTGSAQSH